MVDETCLAQGTRRVLHSPFNPFLDARIVIVMVALLDEPYLVTLLVFFEANYTVTLVAVTLEVLLGGLRAIFVQLSTLLENFLETVLELGSLIFYGLNEVIVPHDVHDLSHELHFIPNLKSLLL